MLKQLAFKVTVCPVAAVTCTDDPHNWRKWASEVRCGNIIYEILQLWAGRYMSVPELVQIRKTV